MNKVLIVGLLLVGGVLCAQDTPVSSSNPNFVSDYDPNAPAWLLRNWGRAAREERRLDEAFFLLTRSLEKDPGNPETLTELALSHFASSDLHQAREYLNRALANRSLLSSPDLEYYILYQLAEIYTQSEDSDKEYERILLEIVSNDDDFTSTDIAAASLRKNIRSILNAAVAAGTTSLDQTIVLYRINDSFSLEAHIKLGRFYVHSGRYDEAQLHLIFAVLKMYTRVIQKIREIEPLYSFSGSEEFFDKIEGNDTFMTYLQKSYFDEALYYLGAASYGFNPGRPRVYGGIWQTLRYLPYASPYNDIAELQLENPQKELILFGSQQFREEVNKP